MAIARKRRQPLPVGPEPEVLIAFGPSPHEDPADGVVVAGVRLIRGRSGQLVGRRVTNSTSVASQDE